MFDGLGGEYVVSECAVFFGGLGMASLSRSMGVHLVSILELQCLFLPACVHVLDRYAKTAVEQG